MKMKNGKINQFFKRKTCENASTSERVKVSRIEEVTTSMPQPIEVPLPSIEEVTTSMPQPIEVPLSSIEEVITSMPQPIEVPSLEEVTTATPQRAEVPSIEEVEVDVLNSIERDPGKRLPIWKYPPNEVDQIRRAYMKWGPYQIRLKDYPLSGKGDHPRRFQETWFEIFYSWLEYSPSKDAAYCLPCYLFNKGPSGNSGSDAFITTGFRGWKRGEVERIVLFLSI
ncbi:hypothetical protein QL285_067140 [Trifolium repens]|nr:hypothetical protein QL285_067140 [Trifolium repens]